MVNGPGTVILTCAVGVGAQELDVATSTGMLAADLADHARHRIGMAAAVERGAGIVDVDAVERGGEAVGVAFAADLAVGDDVEPGPLLVANGEQRRVVLRLLEIGLRDAPQLLARTRGGKRPASFSRSISQSGCA